MSVEAPIRRNRAASKNGSGGLHLPADPIERGKVEPNEPRDPAPDLGVEVEVVRLNTTHLNSAGEAYQRPVDQDYVDYLVEHWDWNAARTLLVNQRPDGTYWLVDGQHRTLAARQKFGGDVEFFCYLTHVPGPAEEAQLYERVSDGHSRLSPAVLFRGRLTRREPIAVDIDRIAQEEGFALALVGRAESEFQLTIPAVLDRIYKRDGAERLRAILRFTKRAWSGQPAFASSHVVTGLAKFFEYFAACPAFDADRAAEVLSQFPLPTLVKEGVAVQAETLRHRHIAFALALQRTYNSHVGGGKRAKLFRKGEQ
jgi:hypothetical protein